LDFRRLRCQEKVLISSIGSGTILTGRAAGEAEVFCRSRWSSFIRVCAVAGIVFNKEASPIVLRREVFPQVRVGMSEEVGVLQKIEVIIISKLHYLIRSVCVSSSYDCV
jgi:hypothetical protein